jgi:hypothetical protein
MMDAPPDQGGDVQATTGDQKIAGVLTLVGGALAAGAAFLDWTDFAPQDGDATTFVGTDLTAGLATLAFGVVLVVVALFLFARGGRTGGRGASILAIVFAALVLFAAGYSAIAPGDALAEFESSRVADEYGISDEVAKEAIKTGLEAENIDVSALVGSWAGSAGGVLALLGGVVGVARSGRIRKRRAAVAAPMTVAPSAAPPVTAPPSTLPPTTPPPGSPPSSIPPPPPGP